MQFSKCGVNFSRLQEISYKIVAITGRMTPGRSERVGASKRQLESSVDWHTVLLDQFDAACNDVRYRQLPVRLNGQVIVHHASTSTSPSSCSTASGIQQKGELTVSVIRNSNYIFSFNSAHKTFYITKFLDEVLDDMVKIKVKLNKTK